MIVVLNLYGSRDEALKAFNLGLETIDYESSLRRDLVIRTTDKTILYRYYVDYQTARMMLLGYYYQKINFYCELPESVKLHFMSRIRWTYGTYKE